MRIDNIRQEHTSDYTELSALIDGYRVWYRVAPEGPVTSHADPFVIIANYAAMLHGGHVEVAAPAVTSPRLLNALPRVQEIVNTWNPRFKKIPIHTETSPAMTVRRGVASMFSGGVDGSYTLIKHFDEITHLITAHGIDTNKTNIPKFNRTVARNREAAASLGKQFICITSNALDFWHDMGVAKSLAFGAYLASFGSVLGIPRLYIAAGDTFTRLAPSGQHYLLDALWSNEACEVIHDGEEALRWEKVQALAARQDLLDLLRVCNSKTHEYNCGECEKCLRTMSALSLLGLSSRALPGFSWDKVRKLSMGPRYIAYYKEMYALAKLLGNREAERALRTCITRHQIQAFLLEFDQLVLGARLHNWHRARLLRKLPPGVDPNPDLPDIYNRTRIQMVTPAYLAREAAEGEHESPGTLAKATSA